MTVLNKGIMPVFQISLINGVTAEVHLGARNRLAAGHIRHNLPLRDTFSGETKPSAAVKKPYFINVRIK